MSSWSTSPSCATGSVKSVIAVGLGAVVGFAALRPPLRLPDRPATSSCARRATAGRSTNCQLLATDPLEGFSVRIKVATYGGIALAMPILLWQLWRFVSPGPLRQGEAPTRIPFICAAPSPSSPWAPASPTGPCPRPSSCCRTSAATTWSRRTRPSKYFQLIVYMMLAFGLGFEFPIVLVVPAN